LTEPLHIRCGDDLRERLPRAGIAGDYLCFADPVCQGPAADDGNLLHWLAQRSRFVAGHSGQDAGEVRQRLGREYAGVIEAHRHAAVWLWFEHNLWDQAALLRVLSLLARRPVLQGRLWLLPADGVRSFPALSDAELAALRPVPVTEAQMAEAAEAWAAFTAPDPGAAAALAQRDLALPFLAAALRRHLRDLPWTTDGLAETERLVLFAVRRGAREEAAVLRALHIADPVFPPTDLILRDVLARLQRGAGRLLTRTAPLELTARGLAVLADRERHRPAMRMLGGVAVSANPAWLWDPDHGPVARPAAPAEDP